MDALLEHGSISSTVTIMRGENMRTTKQCLFVMMTAVFVLLTGPGGLFVKAAKAADGDVPKFELDPSWPKPLPKLWVSAEVGGTCVDAQDHVFILNRDNLTPDEQK